MMESLGSPSPAAPESPTGTRVDFLHSPVHAALPSLMFNRTLRDDWGQVSCLIWRLNPRNRELEISKVYLSNSHWRNQLKMSLYLKLCLTTPCYFDVGLVILKVSYLIWRLNSRGREPEILKVYFSKSHWRNQLKTLLYLKLSSLNSHFLSWFRIVILKGPHSGLVCLFPFSFKYTVCDLHANCYVSR